MAIHAYAYPSVKGTPFDRWADFTDAELRAISTTSAGLEALGALAIEAAVELELREQRKGDAGS